MIVEVYITLHLVKLRHRQRNQYGINTKHYAKFGAWWFKNVSPFLSKLVGNNDTREINEIFNTDRTDFYDYVMRDHIPEGVIESSSYKNPYVKRGTLLIKDNARKLFYEGLINTIKDEFEKAKKEFIENEVLKTL